MKHIFLSMLPARPRWSTARSLLIAFGVLILGLPSVPRCAGAGAQDPQPRPPSQPPKRQTDIHGALLPVGAIARLGTVRWRTSTVSGTLAFSRDGRYLAAPGDQTPLFDAASGQLVRNLPGSSVYQFFPADGKTLITASGGNRISVWDLPTGKERRQIRAVAGSSFAWSADGKLLAIYNFPGGPKPFVSFWDMDSGKKRGAWDWRADFDIPQQLALAPDGKMLALRTRTAVDLYDVASRQHLHRLACPLADDIGFTQETRLVDFSADGKALACTEGDSVRVWDTLTGKSLHRFRVPDSKPLAVLFSPPGGLLAASNGNGVYLWDLGTGKLARVLVLSASDQPALILAFSHDGKRLATQALYSAAVRLWDVTSGRQLPAPEAPTSHVMSLAFAPDGKTIASVESLGTVWLWDARTGKLQRRCAAMRSLALPGWQPIAFLGAGQTAVTGGYEDDVVGWDLRSGARLYARKIDSVAPGKPGNPRVTVYPQCSPDGKNVVTIFPGALKREEWPRDRREKSSRPIYWTRVGLWDPETAKMTRSFQVGAENVRGLRLSPDGRRLVGFGELPNATNRPLLFVWDLVAERELRRLPRPDAELWASVAFSADGRTLLIVALHGVQGLNIRFEFWEVATGRRRAAAECSLKAAARLPVGWPAVFADERLAALALKTNIYLVDPLTGKELKCLHGEREWPWHLAFSPDRKLLVSSQDTSALVWDAAVPASAQEGAHLSAKQLADCWADLAGQDAERAYRAVRGLAGCPAQAVTFVGERLRPVPREQDKLRRLLADLDNAKYVEREAASRELARRGEAAEDALRQFLEDHPSQEARRRAEDLLAKLKKAEGKLPPIPGGESLQILRGVEVLERIGGPEAERLLQRLAAGAPHALVTREARASCQRLALRAPVPR